MQKPSPNQSQIDNSIYDTLGDRWYTAFDDPVALLRAESKTKAPWVLDKIKDHFPKTQGLKLLDVGCGGGLLSNRFAKEGLNVTGLDVSEESLRVATRYDQTKSVQYLLGNAYQLPFAPDSFEVITAMDFLEHIEKPGQVIAEIARVLKPEGLFFFHTFNRNWLANIIVIQLVEKLVKNTPKNMHVIDLFITPKELRHMCKEAGLEIQEMIGIRPLFSTLTVRSVCTGIVPEQFAFRLTRSLKLSYMGYATKTID